MRLLMQRLFIAATLSMATVVGAAHGFTPQELWNAWPEERFVTTTAPCLRPAELEESLHTLAERHAGDLQLEEIGRSFLERPIYQLTLGRGETKILLWSQMHGDEPSATPALLDIADFLLKHAEEPEVAAILDQLTLLMIPMLNPDGAEVYTRRNAQGIDINRDALNLATPEGRLLKAVRDRHEPLLGFNLHDQNRRTAVGNSGLLATNAVLAVAGDAEGTVTSGRLRAKRACAAIVKALAPFMPGHMARYDEDWSPRAFGDNLTAWGTPVVLIESGGLPPGRDLSELTRLNFVAIVAVLQDLVRDDLAGHDPQLYEELLRNQSNSWSDVAVRGGRLWQPGTATPYRADLSFDRLRGDRQMAGCAAGEPTFSRIVEIGDSRFLAAGTNIDATERVLVAPFAAGVEGWRARRWLSGEVLERLARLGVGTVSWRVSPRRTAAAEAHAARVNGSGRTRLRVTTAIESLPWLTLVRAPGEPATDSLREVLNALQRTLPKRRAGELSLTAETLQLLWPDGRQNAGPALRRGRAASFLFLDGVGDARPRLDDARLQAVWIDGVEVALDR